VLVDAGARRLGVRVVARAGWQRGAAPGRAGLRARDARAVTGGVAADTVHAKPRRALGGVRARLAQRARAAGAVHAGTRRRAIGVRGAIQLAAAVHAARRRTTHGLAGAARAIGLAHRMDDAIHGAGRRTAAAPHRHARAFAVLVAQPGRAACRGWLAETKAARIGVTRVHGHAEPAKAELVAGTAGAHAGRHTTHAIHTMPRLALEIAPAGRAERLARARGARADSALVSSGRPIRPGPGGRIPCSRSFGAKARSPVEIAGKRPSIGRRSLALPGIGVALLRRTGGQQAGQRQNEYPAVQGAPRARRLDSSK
jgi:hypothetical protein